MRGVIQTWMTNAAADTQNRTWARKLLIASSWPAPLNTSAAMFSCWSINIAPIEPKLMTTAMS